MDDVKERMRKLLLNDRLSGRDELPRIIKSEAYDMLSDFFELDKTGITVAIEGDEDGYNVTVKARAVRVL